MSIRDPKQKIRVRTYEREEQSLARRYLRWFILICSVGIFVTLVWYATRIPQVTITDVSVKGGITVSHEEVKTAVKDVLEGAYMMLIPKRFSFTYPEEEILRAIARIPRTHHISVVRNGFASLSVTFEEHMPDALWCVDDTATKCMYVNEDGKAFTEAPHLEGGALVRYRVEGVDEIKEDDTLNTALIHELKTLRAQMNNDLKLRVSQIVLKKSGDVELHCNGGGMVLISNTKDIQSTFEDLTAILTSKEFSHLEPGNFKYIDLRFERKVFVNETMDVATTTTEVGTTTLP